MRHSDKVPGPPGKFESGRESETDVFIRRGKRGEVRAIMPGLSLRARRHPAVAEASAAVLDYLDGMHSQQAQSLLRLANCLLEPLLEFGSARPRRALDRDHKYYGCVEQHFHCVSVGDHQTICLEGYHLSADRRMVKKFIVDRCLHQCATWFDGFPGTNFVNYICLVALGLLTPEDVLAGLPSPTTAFRSGRWCGDVVAEVIDLRGHRSIVYRTSPSGLLYL